MAEETKTTTETTDTVDYKAELEATRAELAKVKSGLDKASSEVVDYKRKEKYSTLYYFTV